MSYVENPSFEKVVLIDYLTVSFDCFDIRYKDNDYIIGNKDLFQRLLRILGYHDDPLMLQKEVSGLHGFTKGYRIGEFIRISYGGEQGKSSSGEYPLSLEMSGQACREFEHYLKGDWLELFKFIFEYEEQIRVTTFHLATDDYTGNEIRFKTIRELYESKHFVTSFRKASYIRSDDIYSDQLYSTGETLYFGSRDGNQLVIYNKMAEMQEKGRQSEIKSDYHYRFELRFKGERSKLLVKTYLDLGLQKQSQEFMLFVASELLKAVEFKDPEDKNSRVRRKRIHPAWQAFLNNVSKSELTVKAPDETTIERKLKWFKEDMASTMIEFAAAKDFDGLENYIYQMMLDHIDDLKSKKVSRINNHLSKLNKKFNRETFKKGLIERIHDNEIKSVEPKTEMDYLKYTLTTSKLVNYYYDDGNIIHYKGVAVRFNVTYSHDTYYLGRENTLFFSHKQVTNLLHIELKIKSLLRDIDKDKTIFKGF